MKIHHWYPNAEGRRIYDFRREPQEKLWHIWFGLHLFTIQFACKCAACRLKRWRARLERWFGHDISDEEWERAGRRWGVRGEHAIKQAITQARFRNTMKEKKDDDPVR